MNQKNEEQHYVSQVLLKRFKLPGKPLQCYQVRTGEWKERGLRRTFAARGWNQLLVAGQVDNNLEAAFSKVESHMSDTFKALEEASINTVTVLPREIYDNMCLYCIFLSLTSPFAKAKAVADFVIQLDFELQNGKDEFLRELNFNRATIERFREAHT